MPNGNRPRSRPPTSVEAHDEVLDGESQASGDGKADHGPGAERWSQITRDLRRTDYLSEYVDFAAVDTQVALASELDPQTAVRAALHYHLAGAWTAGAAERADLISTINTLRAHVEQLRRRVRELINPI